MSMSSIADLRGPEPRQVRYMHAYVCSCTVRVTVFNDLSTILPINKQNQLANAHEHHPPISETTLHTYHSKETGDEAPTDGESATRGRIVCSGALVRSCLLGFREVETDRLRSSIPQFQRIFKQSPPSLANSGLH